MISEKIRRVLSPLIMGLLGMLVIGAGIGVAGNYEGLEPGVSRKSDVDKRLGAPIREVVRGVKYEYKPAAEDTVRVLFSFSKTGGIVERIEVYPRDAYLKEQLKQWLELTEPNKTGRDKAGNHVEYYTSDGVSLHFKGPDSNSTVTIISHFNPSSLSEDIGFVGDGGTIIKDLASERPPETASQYVQAAKNAETHKNWSGMKGLVEEGVRRYPQSAELWSLRSHYYFYCKSETPETRRREAMRSAQRAHDLEPTTERAMDVGWLYMQVFKDYSMALSYFERNEKEYGPKNPALYYWMAKCYEEARYPYTARDYYNRFLRLAPQHEYAPDARTRLSRLP